MRSVRPLLLGLLLCTAIAVPARSSGPPRSAVFYDVSEKLATLATANFTTDFNALITTKGLGALGLDTSVSVYLRQPAVVFAGQEKTLPGLGCYTRNARTQAKSQQERANSMEGHYEYLCRGADPVKIRAQAELAAEVLLLLVDRVAGSGSGLEDAGGEPLSVVVDIDGSGPAEGLEFYEEWVHVVFPVWETDII